MYDVIYLDQRGETQVLGARLERDSAAELARSEARRRQACRMFLAGSSFTPRSDMVLVVESELETV